MQPCEDIAFFLERSMWSIRSFWRQIRLVKWRSSVIPGQKSAAVFCIYSREKSRSKNKNAESSSQFQGPSSEEEVQRPRVGAGTRKSLGMQFQQNVAPSEEQPAVAIGENEDSLLNINDIIDPELQSTRVKVFTLWSSGRTNVRAREAKEDIYLRKMLP